MSIILFHNVVLVYMIPSLNLDSILEGTSLKKFTWISHTIPKILPITVYSLLSFSMYNNKFLWYISFIMCFIYLLLYIGMYIILKCKISRCYVQNFKFNQPLLTIWQFISNLVACVHWWKFVIFNKHNCKYYF